MGVSDGKQGDTEAAAEDRSADRASETSAPSGGAGVRSAGAMASSRQPVGVVLRAQRPNKYGVFTRPERILVAAGRGLHVEFRLARHHQTGLWAFGLQIEIGTTEVYSFRHAFLPAERDARLPSRDDALAAARRAASRLLRERCEEPLVNPEIVRLCKAALGRIADSRQRRLFA